MSIWVWIGRHRRALKLGSVAAALLLCVGGVALGMTSASGSPAPAGPGVIAPAAAFEKPSRHYLVGTVALVTAPGRAIVRGQGGRFVVVEYDRETLVRRNRQAQGIAALRRGTRVIILGEPRNGRLHADVITVTGMVPPRPLPSPAAPAVPAPRPRPATAPTTVPTMVPTKAPAAATPASSSPLPPATPTAAPLALAPSAPPAVKHTAAREPSAGPRATSPPMASPPPAQPAPPNAVAPTPAARHEATAAAPTAATRAPSAPSRPSTTPEPNTVRTVAPDVVVRLAPTRREGPPARPPSTRPQPHRPSLPR